MRLNYRKKTILLITIATLIRCLIASSIELGNDEVYYRIYAQYLQWNYFDHPPMVGWLIRFTTANLLLNGELFIRLGAIASAAATTWLLFLCGHKLLDAYTGYLAALIYTATVYGSIIAGTFILPDSPQMVCWSAGLYVLIKIADTESIDKRKKVQMLCFGIITGIGMLCKIHTSFLWLGFLFYLIFCNALWLRQPALYVSGLITLAFFYPVIQWNIDNHFVTWLYHSNRVNLGSGGFNLASFLTFAGGQLLYTNPILFPFFVLAGIAAIKNKVPVLLSQRRILLFCSLPLIIVAAAVSLFKNVLPHWTGPAYSGLILLTACYFRGLPTAKNVDKLKVPKPLKLSLSLLAFICLSGPLVVHFYPGTLGSQKKENLGEGDFTLDMYGWKELTTPFQHIVELKEKAGLMQPGAVVISNRWFTAAHLDLYVAMPLKKDLVALGDTSDIHQYAWINNQRKKLKPGDDAWCIVSSENYFNAIKNYAPIFNKSVSMDTIIQKRSGRTCRLYYVCAFRNYTP
jgi:hypothetical protein